MVWILQARPRRQAMYMDVYGEHLRNPWTITVERAVPVTINGTMFCARVSL